MAFSLCLIAEAHYTPGVNAGANKIKNVPMEKMDRKILMTLIFVMPTAIRNALRTRAN